MKTKCVILVTNQMHFLKKSSKILCLVNGECLSIGTFNQLSESGIDFVSILKQQIDGQENDSKQSTLRSHSKKKKYLNQINLNPNIVNGFNIEDENKNTGEIGLKVCFNYFNSSTGWPLILFAFLSAFLTQAVYHLTDYWLTFW